ncbi:MAG TPA: hypothetical protein VIK72_19270 [Clostridiaceae bacterium]
MSDVREQAGKDYKQGMTYKDIASKYGIGVNTLKSWKHRENWLRGEKVAAKKVAPVKTIRIEKVAQKVAPVEIIVAPSNPVGNRSRWPEIREKLTLIEAWVRNGLSNKQVADNLGINVATLYDYKNKHIELANAFKFGKEVTDIIIENALYKKAQGYTYKEITEEPLYNPDGKAIRDDEGNHKIAVTKVVTKHLSPDVTAIKFWLANRKPAEWRERKEVDLNATIGRKLEDYLE